MIGTGRVFSEENIRTGRGVGISEHLYWCALLNNLLKHV